MGKQLEPGVQLEVPPQPPVPAYLVAWDSYPELKMSTPTRHAQMALRGCMQYDQCAHLRLMAFNGIFHIVIHLCCLHATGTGTEWRIQVLSANLYSCDAGTGQQNGERVCQSVNPGAQCYKMQFQLAVYTDIVVDRLGNSIAMGAKVILMDEVNKYLSCSDPALPKCPRVL